MRLVFDDAGKDKKPLNGDDLVRFLDACRQLGMPLGEVTLSGKTKIGLGSGPLRVIAAEWNLDKEQVIHPLSSTQTQPTVPMSTPGS